MAIADGIIAVLSPRRLRTYSFSPDEQGGVTVRHLRSIELQHSIATAHLRFERPDHSAQSTRLYLALSGDDGIFVYSVPKDRLRVKGPHTDLSCVWSHRATSIHLSEPDGSYYDDPFKILLGSTCSSISWLSVHRTLDRPVTFVTLPYGFSNADGLELSSSTSSTSSSVYGLNHPDMPALYAMGVFDYDETLGLGVFGNVFGELCLLKLAAPDMSTLEGCFEPLNIPLANDDADFLPTVSPDYVV